MSSKPPERRIILPENTRTQAELKLSVNDVNVDTMMDDAMHSLAIEIKRFRIKVGRGNTLDMKEARILQGYLETLLKMKKEFREEERDSKMDKLSNEELLLLAKKVIGENSNIVEQPEDNDQADD